MITDGARPRFPAHKWLQARTGTDRHPKMMLSAINLPEKRRPHIPLAAANRRNAMYEHGPAIRDYW